VPLTECGIMVTITQAMVEDLDSILGQVVILDLILAEVVILDTIQEQAETLDLILEQVDTLTIILEQAETLDSILEQVETQAIILEQVETLVIILVQVEILVIILDQVEILEEEVLLVLIQVLEVVGVIQLQADQVFHQQADHPATKIKSQIMVVISLAATTINQVSGVKDQLFQTPS